MPSGSWQLADGRLGLVLGGLAGLSALKFYPLILPLNHRSFFSVRFGKTSQVHQAFHSPAGPPPLARGPLEPATMTRPVGPGTPTYAM